MRTGFRRIPICVFCIGLTIVCPRQPAVAATSASAMENSKVYLEPKLLTGKIYERESEQKNLLFIFKRTATTTNSTVEALREYRRPDGTLAARERVLYKENNLVSYDVEQLQAGSKGKVLIRPDPKKSGQMRIFFEQTPRQGPTKEKSEVFQPNVLLNDMIPLFILSHWQELMRRASVPFRFLVTTRMQTIGLKLAKTAEGTRDGKRVIYLRMEPTNPLLAQFFKPPVFTVEADGQHRILDYAGRTTPHIFKNGKWVELDAFTVFDWK